MRITRPDRRYKLLAWVVGWNSIHWSKLRMSKAKMPSVWRILVQRELRNIGCVDCFTFKALLEGDNTIADKHRAAFDVPHFCFCRPPGVPILPLCSAFGM